MMFLYMNASASIAIPHTWGFFSPTVSNLTNQIMIPGSGIMDGLHQINVYRLPHLLLPPGIFFFTPPHLGACLQAIDYCSRIRSVGRALDCRARGRRFDSLDRTIT